jgi:hypothetical protein
MSFLFRYENIAASFAAKIIGSAVMPQADSLMPGNQSAADRVFLQHILDLCLFFPAVLPLPPQFVGDFFPNQAAQQSPRDPAQHSKKQQPLRPHPFLSPKNKIFITIIGKKIEKSNQFFGPPEQLLAIIMQ